MVVEGEGVSGSDSGGGDIWGNHGVSGVSGGVGGREGGFRASSGVGGGGDWSGDGGWVVAIAVAAATIETMVAMKVGANDNGGGSYWQ